jgi:hypothetical protein
MKLPAHRWCGVFPKHTDFEISDIVIEGAKKDLCSFFLFKREKDSIM